ncbi:hypothetical protein D3C86_1783080 [compost metagenome]
MGDAREEKIIQRFLLMALKQQVVNMSLSHFRRVARINRAVFAAFLPHFFTRLIAKHDILPIDTQRLEIGPPKGCSGPNV